MTWQLALQERGGRGFGVNVRQGRQDASQEPVPARKRGLPEGLQGCRVEGQFRWMWPREREGELAEGRDRQRQADALRMSVFAQEKQLAEKERLKRFEKKLSMEQNLRKWQIERVRLEKEDDTSSFDIGEKEVTVVRTVIF